MEKAKFSILKDSAQAIVETFYKDGQDISAQLFASGPNSLVNYLTEDARGRLLDEFGTVEEIGVLARKQGGPAKIVEVASVPNPYRFHTYDNDHGFIPESSMPVGLMLPFRKDPSEIGVAASPAVDLRIGVSENGAPAQQHRAPGVHGSATFMGRTQALRLMDFKGVPTNRKNKVHVFVVDQGMNPKFVDTLGGPGTYGGIIWWDQIFIPFPPIVVQGPPKPSLGDLPTEQRHRYRSMPQWHAHMTVRNILSIAGDNRNLKAGEEPIVFYDVPVIPNRVGQVLDTANNISFQNLAIFSKKLGVGPKDAVVVVNAWGIKDRRRENPQGAVSETPGHGLNQLITFLANQPKISVVFAAGNTGSFTPDPEAGPYDKGPGRSIWHPNSLEHVLSTGACDCSGKWIGSSSQGSPGAAGANLQPKLSAPSYFREDMDAHVATTGSSGSCGMLAGLIAKRWREHKTPLDVAAALGNAKKIGHTGHSNRLGFGIATDNL